MKREDKVFAGSQTKLPGNWMAFLRDPMNKKELFAFLTSRIEEFHWPPDKTLYVTSGQAVSYFGSSSTMNCCNHEKADTRIVVHVRHALEQGAKGVHAYCGHRCHCDPCRHIP